MEFPSSFLDCKAYTIELRELLCTIPLYDFMKRVEVTFALRVMYYRLSKYQCLKTTSISSQIQEFELAFPELVISVPKNEIRHNGCTCKESIPIDMDKVSAIVSLLNKPLEPLPSETNDNLFNALAISDNNKSVTTPALADELSTEEVMDSTPQKIEEVKITAEDGSKLDGGSGEDSPTPGFEEEQQFPDPQTALGEEDSSHDITLEYQDLKMISQYCVAIDDESEIKWRKKEVALVARTVKFSDKIQQQIGLRTEVCATIDRKKDGSLYFCMYYHGIVQKILGLHQVIDYSVFSAALRSIPMTSESVILLHKARYAYLKTIMKASGTRLFPIIEYLDGSVDPSDTAWQRVLE